MFAVHGLTPLPAAVVVITATAAGRRGVSYIRRPAPLAPDEPREEILATRPAPSVTLVLLQLGEGLVL